MTSRDLLEVVLAVGDGEELHGEDEPEECQRNEGREGERRKGSRRKGKDSAKERVAVAGWSQGVSKYGRE